MLLLITLMGCGGKVNLAADDNALRFTGDGCASIPLPAEALTPAFTFELTMNGPSDHAYGPMPLASWPGVFSLVELEDDNGWAGNDDLSQGVPYVDGFLDDTRHHLAVTLSEDQRATLFVDGRRIGFGALTPGAPSAVMELGCWSGQGEYEGWIDEVRLSSVVRYSSDFTPPLAPFAPDTETTGLWHMDEGEGVTFADDMGRYPGTLSGVGWIYVEDTGGSL